MAKFCRDCGKKLPFLTRFTEETLCKDCKASYEAELSEIEREIVAARDVTEEHLEALKKHDTNSLIGLYAGIYNRFEADKELEEAEIETLGKIQQAFGLTEEQVKFGERIRPYLYVNIIKKGGKLPKVDLHIKGGRQVILRKEEVVHFADIAILKELKSVSLGYEGGSHGVSFRIAKGVRYRVGAHRGHIVKEDRLVETSRGVLMITNQRLFLHPVENYKPVSIPLKKILSYQCFNNGIQIYKEGREKGYFFSIDKSSSVELFGLCVSYLLTR